MKITRYLKIAMIGLISGCVLAPETYNNSIDRGVYRGTAIAYEGKGTDANFVDRVCPHAKIILTVNENNILFEVTDIYPNYTHDAGVIQSHSGMAEGYGNNKFMIDLKWAYHDTSSSTQLNDLMNLNICDATAPSNPTDNYTGSKGRLGSLGLIVPDNFGHQGEFGFGVARGTLVYGVECNDGERIPLCVYFMNLKKD